MYDINDALAAAVAVYRNFGFIKRNHGYIDQKTGEAIADSKSILANSLRDPDNRMEGCAWTEITDDDRQRGIEIKEYFKQKILMKQMSDEVDQFTSALSAVLEKDTVTAGRDLSILASLPNSMDIEDRRTKIDAMYHANRLVGSYYGILGRRYKVECDVKDVKWIPRNDCYLVTLLTDEQQILKFFMSGESNATRTVIDDQNADLSECIRDRQITFVGTVTKQDVNPHTECHETKFNRVKIVDVK
jgi:hypothetical protein